MELQNEIPDIEVQQIRDILFSDYIKKLIDFEEQIGELKKKIDFATASENMAPAVEMALNDSIQKNKEKMAAVIFPIIGPAIRKSIQEALNALLQNMQVIIERMTSIENIKWRIQALIKGVPVSEIILRNVLLYKVEYVYLIHRVSGKVISYVQSTEAVAIDKLVFSGMIQAVKIFAEDVFSSSDQIKLNHLDFDQFKIILSETPLLSLVVLIRGMPPVHIDQLFYELAEEINSNYKDQFKSSNIENWQLHGCELILKKGLIEQKKAPVQKSNSNTQIKYAVLALIILFLTGLFLWNTALRYTSDKNYQMAISEIYKFDHVLITSGDQSEQNIRLTSFSSNPSEINEKVNGILLKYKVPDSKLKVYFYQIPISSLENNIQTMYKLKLAIQKIELLSVEDISNESIQLLTEINQLSVELKKNTVVYIEFNNGLQKVADQALFGLLSRLPRDQFYDYHFLRTYRRSKNTTEVNRLNFKVIMEN